MRNLISLARFWDRWQSAAMSERQKMTARLSKDAQERIEEIRRALGGTSKNTAINYAILNVPLPSK